MKIKQFQGKFYWQIQFLPAQSLWPGKKSLDRNKGRGTNYNFLPHFIWNVWKYFITKKGQLGAQSYRAKTSKTTGGARLTSPHLTSPVSINTSLSLSLDLLRRRRRRSSISIACLGLPTFKMFR